MAVRILFEGVDVADLAPLTVLVKVGDEPATIEVSREGLGMELGNPASEAQVEVAGEPEQVFGFLAGTAAARTDGLRVRGSREAIRRLHTVTTRSPLAEDEVALSESYDPPTSPMVPALWTSKRTGADLARG
jgi:hypothetical protein